MRRWRQAAVALSLVVALAIAVILTQSVVPISSTTQNKTPAITNAWLKTVQENLAREEYRVNLQNEALQAPNRTQNFRTHFRNDGITIAPREENENSWSVQLRLANHEATQPRVNANEVSYEHGALREVYRNDTDGLEQIFELAARPDNAPRDSFVLEVEVNGLHAVPNGDNGADDILLQTPQNVAVLRYSKLVVTDANDVMLPARMEARGSSIALIIEDRDATYPLVIDPLVTSASWSYNVATLTQFGFSVAGAGDINNDGYADIIAGAPNDNSGRGKAYLFLGTSCAIHMTGAACRMIHQSRPPAVCPDGRTGDGLRIRGNGRGAWI